MFLHLMQNTIAEIATIFTYLKSKAIVSDITSLPFSRLKRQVVLLNVIYTNTNTSNCLCLHLFRNKRSTSLLYRPTVNMCSITHG